MTAAYHLQSIGLLMWVSCSVHLCRRRLDRCSAVACIHCDVCQTRGCRWLASSHWLLLRNNDEILWLSTAGDTHRRTCRNAAQSSPPSHTHGGQTSGHGHGGHYRSINRKTALVETTMGSLYTVPKFRELWSTNTEYRTVVWTHASVFSVFVLLKCVTECNYQAIC